MDWKYIITTLVAVYGAILATINLINNYKKNKTFIKTTLTWGTLTNGDTDLKFFISATNPSNKKIYLNAVGFKLPNKKTLYLPSPKSNNQFPCEISSGRGCTVWCDVVNIAKQLKQEGYSQKIKLKGFYKDELGNEYKSKQMKFDLDGKYNA